MTSFVAARCASTCGHCFVRSQVGGVAVDFDGTDPDSYGRDKDHNKDPMDS